MRLSALLVASFALVACGEAQKPPADPTDPNVAGLEPQPPASANDAAPSAEVERGQKQLEAGDKAGAKASFDAALAKNSKDPEAHYYVGLMAEQAGDAAAAESHYRAALAAKPGLEPAAINLSAFYLDSGKFDDAAKVIDAARKSNPQSAPLTTNQALALAGKGDQAGAKAAFANAEKLSPNDPAVLILEAQWLTQWNDAAGAKAKLLAAKRLVGDDAAQLASIGFELKNAGAFAECVESLSTAIGKLGPTAKGAGELRVLRGLCKIGLKDSPGALADFLDAKKVEPSFAPAHYYLGGRYAEAGKWSEAEAAYAQYVKLSPQGELAAKAKERLEAIKAKKSGKGVAKKK